MRNVIERGDILFADLGEGIGSEQLGVRPVLIVQNDVGNVHSPTTIVAPITSTLGKKRLPTHVEFHGYGLKRNQTILLEQVRTIDKDRLQDYRGHLPAWLMEKVDRALMISVGL